MNLQGRPTSTLHKKLTGYTLLGAAAFTVTGKAHGGTITYVAVGQSFNATSGPNSYTFNLPSYTPPGPNSDITVTATKASPPASLSGVTASPSSNSDAMILMDPATTGDVAALSAGALIDPGGANWGGGTTLVDYKSSGPDKGDWPSNGTSAYLAFYFNHGLGEQAGWALISTSAASSGGAFTIESYAYQDVGGATILAGEGAPAIAATPEPSTLSLLALGAAGLLEVRRRRQARA